MGGKRSGHLLNIVLKMFRSNIYSMDSFKKLAKIIFEKLGLEVRKVDKSFFILDKDFKDIYDFCKPFTMTSLERMYALYKATEYVIKGNINGDIVECGVWRGGSAMLVAKILLKLGCTEKKIYLYDTYEGMTKPSEVDIDNSGKKAYSFFAKTKKGETSNWCFSPLEEVKKNMMSIGYPEGKIIFIKGKVEDTVPGTVPSAICLLRLDTDWYESTYHEMKHLYPVVAKGGVLVLDDYGYWQGARMAVEKYLNESDSNILLNRIDFSGRIGVKC